MKGADMLTKMTVERAFELAQGRCHTVKDIKRALKLEHYTNVDAHLNSPTLRKQLTALMK